MSQSVRYSLEALLRLRREIKGQWVQCLAEALSQQHQAETQKQHAEQERQAQQARLQLARQRQSAGGEALAKQLGDGVRYLERLVAEEQKLAGLCAKAHARWLAAEQKVEQTRRALQQAEAELKVVEQGQAAWDQARRRAEEQRAEQELEDIVTSRQRALS